MSNPPERDEAYWRALGDALTGEGPGGPDPGPCVSGGCDGAGGCGCGKGAGSGGGLSRRRFLQLSGAGMTLAGVSGCGEPPPRWLVPYAQDPPEVTPGVPLEYATSMALDGFSIGLLGRTREGRPVKLEGNPDHPASLGGTGAWEQASLLSLYDPDRRGDITEDGAGRSWRHVLEALRPEELPEGGRGLRILLEPTSSPTRLGLLRRIRERLPEARIALHAPTGPLHLQESLRGLFGRPVLPIHDFRGVRSVVAVEADFTEELPFRLRYARDFARTRAPDGPGGEMSRLHVAEAAPSPTGSLADHLLPVRPSGAVPLLAALAMEVGAAGDLPGEPAGAGMGGEAREWVRRAAAELRSRGSDAVVVAGAHLPAVAHGLADRINRRVGAHPRRVRYVASPLVAGDAAGLDLRVGLDELVEELLAGEVETLLVLEGDPVHTAPAGVDLADAIARAGASLYLGTHRNRTAEACGWFVPALHYLESWGDGRAFDGTLSTVQPLVRPLRPGRQPEEVLAALLAAPTEPPPEGAEGPRPSDSPRELVRREWRERIHPEHGGDRSVDAFWQESLQRGLVEGSEAERLDEPAPGGEELGRLLSEVEPPPSERIEVRFERDRRVHDGRFGNNAWLQELPDPVTKLTWGNAALLAPATAARLGVERGDLLEVASRGAAVRIPALPVAGHAEEVLTLPLGYGRGGGESLSRGVGIDVYPLRPRPGSPAPAFEVRPAADEDGATLRESLAVTQEHQDTHDREHVQDRTLGHFREHPDFTERHRGAVPSLYPAERGDGPQWAMTIDLNRCTGCSACVVACQAENNIAVVGAEEVRRGREMHWLRIDRYVSGPPERPEVVNQPMACQHCEKAPCEYVCPVNATVHSSDGLNEMVYNRCIGTRFCSNNCPYKVRRFNWFDYNRRRPEAERPVLNPDVTVRERGVMEKCTYCVQRIRRAQLQAGSEGRPVRDGEVRTACQQACPHRAITFGSLNDPGSEVTRSRENPRQYGVLHELGTMPRTRYLARIRNPAPAPGE